jgi:hypothetical protein
LREVAEALGVSERVVKAWSCGEKVPGRDMRDKVSQVLKIPADAWFLAARVTGTGDLFDVSERGKEVQALLNSVREGVESTPLQRAKVLGICVSTVYVLGKLTLGSKFARSTATLAAGAGTSLAAFHDLADWCHEIAAAASAGRSAGE